MMKLVSMDRLDLGEVTLGLVRGRSRAVGGECRKALQEAGEMEPHVRAAASDG